MALSEVFSGIYNKVEETYYGFFDFLEEKGIPLSGYNAFLEEKGIPAMPFTIALILLLIIGSLGVMNFSAGVNQKISFIIKDDFGNPLKDVKITFLNEKNEKIIDAEKSDSTEFLLQGRPLGEKILVEATKKGFKKGTANLEIEKDKPVSLSFTLEREEGGTITGKIRLVDAATDSLISKEKLIVTAKWGKGAEQITRQANFIEKTSSWNFPQIPRGEQVLVDIKADNYESFNQLMRFENEEAITVELKPKASLAGLKVKLTLIVKDLEKQELLQEIGVRIVQQDGEDFANIEKTNSGHSIEIPTEIGFKIEVRKEGFITYLSPEFITIKEDTEQEIFLQKGGESLRVLVLNAINNPVENSLVQLFDFQGNKIGETQTTTFEGVARFEGLNPEEKYFVTVFNEKYLPKRVEVQTKTEKETSIKLEELTSTNSSSLVILVEDNKAVKQANTSLFFYELIEDKQLPLGIPKKETDLQGTLTVNVPQNIKVLVKAVKGGFEGTGETEIKTEPVVQLKIVIELSSTATKILLKDLVGKPVKGKVKIESPTGEILFEGETNGEVFINPGNSKFVKVTFTDASGQTFTEELNVESRLATMKIKTGETTGLEPKIEFLGVFDVRGNKTEGVEKGKDYYLNFELTFPEGDFEGGMHVRVGPDDVKFVDSQFAGVTGFLGDADRFVYGRTYNAFPSPGQQIIDLRNQGVSGEFNKWIELYFNKPKGKKVIKVRVQARESTTADSFELHYRSWIKTDLGYIRTPEDSILQQAAFNSSKSTLYADSIKQDIKIFEGKTNCKKLLCASYNFVTKNRGIFAADAFKAIKDEVNALEIELTATESVKPVVSINTPKDPINVVLTGFDIRNFTEFINQEKEDTSLEISSISLNKNETLKIRVYFKGLNETTSSIATQIVAGNEVIKETFYFPIFVEKEMNVTVSPSNATLGENITVLAKDVDGIGIEDAKIEIKSLGKRTVKTIQGNASNNRGLSGRYFIENNLDPGRYKLLVTAPGFKFFETEIEIGKTNVLKIESPIKLNILKEIKKASKTVSLSNTGEETIENISFTLIKAEEFDESFKVEVSGPTSLPGKASPSNLVIKAEFIGEDIEARKASHVKLVVTGNIVGKYSTKSEETIDLTFNQKLEENCIEFSKQKLGVALLAETDFTKDFGGSFAYSNPPLNPFTNPQRRQELKTVGLSASKNVDFVAKNKCNEKVVLRPAFKGNQFIKIDAQEIALDAGAEQPVIITVTNLVDQADFGRRIHNFDLVFEASQLTKRIPLSVSILSSRFAIIAPTNIEIAIAQPTPNAKIRVVEPIMILNQGEFDIEAIDLSIDPTSEGGLKFSIFPVQAFPLLRRGQSVFPPKAIVIEADQIKSGDVLTQINVFGTIEGKRLLLRTINVISHVSAPGCMQVSPTTFFFERVKPEGVISKEIKIKNLCSEPLRISSASIESELGQNQLGIRPISNQTGLIGLNFEETFALELGVKAISQINTALKINGVLVNSQTPISSEPLTASINIGPTSVQEGKATQEFEMNVCEEPNKKVTVKFPLPTNYANPNCSEGYCDAVQLTDFLAKKINQKVQEIDGRVSLEKGETTGDFKTFEDLKVREEEFTVFFQNDNLTPEELKKAISEDKYYKIRHYIVELDSVKGYEAKRTGKAFLGSRILLETENFRGCGKYIARIKGSVPVINGKLRTDSIILFVEVTQDKDETAECLPVIENFSNFLPRDRDVDAKSSLGVLPGTVFTEQQGLEEMGKKMAEVLFNSSERYVNKNTNKLLLELGTGKELQGRLLKLDIEKASIGEGAKILKATVNDKVFASLAKEKLVEEAAQAINALTQKKLSNMCKSNAGYFLISSSEAVTESLEIPKETLKIRLLRQTSATPETQCTAFNVSALKPVNELVYGFSEEAHSLLATQKINVFELRETNEKGNPGNIVSKISNLPEEFTATNLSSIRESDFVKGKYSRTFNVCALGSAAMAAAHGEKFFTSVKNNDAELFQPQKISVELEACFSNPLKGVEEFYREIESDEAKIKLGEGEKIVKYASFTWKGTPEKLALKDLIDEMLKQGVEVKGFTTNITDQTGANIGKELSKEHNEKIKQANTQGIMTRYLPACAATAAGLGFLTKGGPLGSLFDAVFDCAIPAIVAASSYDPLAKTIYDNSIGVIKKVLGSGWETALELIGGEEKVKEAVEAGVSLETASTPEERYTALNAIENVSGKELDEFFEGEYGDMQKLVAEGTIESTIAGAAAAGTRGRILHPRLVKGFASQLSDQYINAFIKERGLTGEAAKQFRTSAGKVLEERLAKALEADASKIIGKRGARVTTGYLSNQLKTVANQPDFLDKAWEEFVKDTKKIPAGATMHPALTELRGTGAPVGTPATPFQAEVEDILEKTVKTKTTAIANNLGDVTGLPRQNIPITPGGLPTGRNVGAFRDSIRDGLTSRAIAKLQAEGVEITTQLETEIRTFMHTQSRTIPVQSENIFAPRGTTAVTQYYMDLPDNQAKTMVNNALNNTRIKDEIAQALYEHNDTLEAIEKQAANKFLKDSADNALESASKVTTTKKIARLGKNLFTGAARGFFIGSIANFAGLGAWKAFFSNGEGAKPLDSITVIGARTDVIEGLQGNEMQNVELDKEHVFKLIYSKPDLKQEKYTLEIQLIDPLRTEVPRNAKWISCNTNPAAEERDWKYREIKE